MLAFIASLMSFEERQSISLHQLTGVMHFIMSMPNNNDHYTPGRTKLGLELRHLFETLKDKDTRFYYTDVLIDSGKTLQDFVNS